MKNKLVMILLSVVIAFGLWSYVVTVVSPEWEELHPDIPVVLEGQALLEERGLMVTENQTPTVRLTLSGNRADLSLLNRANVQVVADVAKITQTGENRLNFKLNYPTDLVDGAVQMLNPHPQYVTLVVEERSTKEVEVVVDYGTTAVPQNYIADKENRILDSEKVIITGPKPVLDQITQAVISVDLTDRVESFSENYRFALCDKDGNLVDAQLVETNIAQVNLTLKIQRMATIPLKLTIIPGGGATEQTSKITIDPQVITIAGSESKLESITELNLGTINLGEVTGTYEKEFAIYLPQGVTNLTGVTKVKVTITFPELERTTFTVTKFRIINVPLNKKVDVLTQALPVSVRGPKGVVQNMTADDIVITLDFAGVQPGTATMKAEISMGTGFSEVGAVGTYSVSATLRELTEDEINAADSPSA